MRRDPAAFRERFKKWKAGTKVYQYGIPYEDDSHNTDYDQARANQLGYTPDENNHLPTRDYETGRFLKSPAHPTVSLGVWGDMNMGYDVWYNNQDKSLYSQPNFTSTYRDRLPKFTTGAESVDNVNMGPKREISDAMFEKIKRGPVEKGLSGYDPLLGLLVSQKMLGKAFNIGRKIIKQRDTKIAKEDYRIARQNGYGPEVSRFIATDTYKNYLERLLDKTIRVLDFGL